MVLDTAYLDAIVQEARSCFLYEDAPDYLAILEQGMQRLLLAYCVPIEGENTASALKGEYTDLMRAAHSLKGKAGIALAAISEQTRSQTRRFAPGST